MPSKYQVITEMEAEHLRTLTVNTDHYMDFLTTAANNFKYSFQEQLLIFAQKPDATACAEVSWWNKHGRWVNRNTKGIALLVDTDAPYKLRHVFDVSDTNSRAGKEVPIWKLEQRFIEPVRNVLAERYEVDAQESLEDCLLNVAVTFVNDNYQDYLAELMEAKAGSLLEKLDEDNTRLQMLTALSYSVGYMLHIRCGLPGRAYFGNSLDKVCNFNTPEVISILGAAVSDMSEVLLREIAVLVQDLQREERNQNRTFEVPADSRYDVNRTATTEGSAEYGSDLPQGGRVLPAGSDRAGGTEGWEVWNAAAEIPSGEPERHVHSDAVDRQAESASGGDRPSGERDDGNADRADGKAGGREREPESGEPDEVGRADEQHPGSSGGNRAEGTGVPVTRDIGAATMRAVGSTGLEVFHDEWYKDSKAPYFHSDEEKNELLRTSDALKDHRTEIASFFADHEDKNERADFIKTFFDNTFTEMILSNGQRAGYRAFDTVLMMWRGSASDPEQRVIMKWSTVADHINGMIVLHEWLSPDEAVLPSVNEQLSLIGEAESKKDSAFVMPQEAIDYVLSSGSGFEDGKRRIYQQFLKQEGTEANVRFLRREYGIGGHSDAIPGTDYWLEYDAKGLHLSKLHDDGSKAVNLSWNVVEKRIGELIALGRYLSKAEIERISAEQSSTKADQSTAAPANEEEPVQRHYSLGDKVYLGVKEYEILAIDDHMYEMFVKPTFGKKKLTQVKKSDVRRFYNQLVDERILKISTLDGIHNVLHQVFAIAVDDDMIRNNPTDNMLRELKSAHGHEVEKRKALTVEQERIFLEYLRNSPRYNHWYPVFYIMANTGMRVGEITGLRWCDVDFKTGLINVNHTLVYYNHRDEHGCYFSINTPKTKAGIREIPMTEGVVEAFKMEKEYQEENNIISVSHIEGYSDFIFVNRFGEVQHQGTLNKALRRIMRDCNGEILENNDIDDEPVLIPCFSCHVLRHTFATRMCESGLNVKVVQSVLGHADVTTTLQIYVTVSNEMKKREILTYSNYIRTGERQVQNI